MPIAQFGECFDQAHGVCGATAETCLLNARGCVEYRRYALEGQYGPAEQKAFEQWESNDKGEEK